MMYAVLQAVIITAIVAFCAVQMLRKMLPKLSHDLQAKGAHALNQAGMTGMAQKLEPVEAKEGGCGSGCGSCKGCSTSFEIGKN
ncbi:MAG: hypothetical protein QM647_14940 [Asticcacaulis sp.]|uniref:DUF6587 family protein n=1 Tax=Asticcacaulis sp. TaxID=1872648 RepID=UPI0039E23E06